MNPIRPLGPAVKAEVAAELNGLPKGHITEIGDTAYVFTVRLRELEAWYFALGGCITPKEDDHNVTHWTLTTNTDHGHGAPVLVLVSAPNTDQLDPDCAAAIRPHAA